MATGGVVHAQSALHTCQKHDREELDLYCRTCGEVLCAECVRESHVDHKWLVLKKYASELRALAQIKSRDVTSQIDSILGGHEAIFQHFKAEFDRECSQNESNVEAIRVSMHRIVDEVIDKRKDDLQRQSAEKMEKLTSFTGDVRCEIQKTKELVSQLREESATLSSYDIVELYQEIEEALLRLGKLTSLPKDCLREIVFSRKEIKSDAIESMIGTIESTQKTPSPVVQHVKDLDLVKNMPLIFRPVPGERIWFCSNESFKIIDFKGREVAPDVKLSKVNANFQNFKIAQSGDFIIPDKRAKSVCSVSQEGNLKVLFSTELLIPTFLTLTYSGDFLVSLADAVSTTRSDASRRLLRRTTMEGETIKEYEYENDGTTPLFTHPGPTAEHYNGTISVVNGFKDDKGNNTGAVLGLDYHGNVRFRYRGTDDIEIFRPLHVCSDVMGNTLISDLNNRRVHLIDSQGNFVMFLLDEETLGFTPSLVAICEDSLFVSVYKTGSLKLYSYQY